jgi:hypothetical protein
MASLEVTDTRRKKEKVRMKPQYVIAPENKNIINQQLLLSKQKQFPKKNFVIGGIKKQYCSYLHFTESTVEVSTSFEKVSYKCMLCPTVISCKPAESRNVKRHLQFDCKGKAIIANWWIAYNVSQNFTRREISEDEMNLMKFFISSNTSIIQLENQYLRNCLKFSLPCAKTFTETILPSVMDKLSNIIEKKLNDAQFLCLISDIWTNKNMHDFLGLVACTIDSNFNRQFLVIGMTIMPGNHCAENIQLAIENIMQKYDFDTKKILGNFYLFLSNPFVWSNTISIT